MLNIRTPQLEPLDFRRFQVVSTYQETTYNVCMNLFMLIIKAKHSMRNAVIILTFSAPSQPCNQQLPKTNFTSMLNLRTPQLEPSDFRRCQVCQPTKRHRTSMYESFHVNLRQSNQKEIPCSESTLNCRSGHLCIKLTHT